MAKKESRFVAPDARDMVAEAVAVKKPADVRAEVGELEAALEQATAKEFAGDVAESDELEIREGVDFFTREAVVGEPASFRLTRGVNEAMNELSLSMARKKADIIGAFLAFCYELPEHEREAIVKEFCFKRKAVQEEIRRARKAV